MREDLAIVVVNGPHFGIDQRFFLLSFAFHLDLIFYVFAQVSKSLRNRRSLLVADSFAP